MENDAYTINVNGIQTQIHGGGLEPVLIPRWEETILKALDRLGLVSCFVSLPLPCL